MGFVARDECDVVGKRDRSIHGFVGVELFHERIDVKVENVVALRSSRVKPRYVVAVVKPGSPIVSTMVGARSSVSMSARVGLTRSRTS
jgi:hypothetical protein